MYEDSWSSFLNVVGKRELPMLDYYLGGFGYRIPKPGLIFENGHYTANIQFPGLVIRYTLDGKDPDAQSNMYKDPVTENGKGIKLRAFDSRGRGGAISNSSP